jgi:hypothetical protein
MGTRFKDSHEKRQARAKAERAEKDHDLTKLIDEIDRINRKALKSGAYHAGELAELNSARHSLFAIRAGCVRRLDRR